MLMTATQTMTLPTKLLNVRNKKQQMQNDLINFFNENDMKWYASDVVADGERLLSNMVDLLWYIDGHHAIFNGKNKKTFSRFIGYNIPENSKYRKRQIDNVSIDSAGVFSQSF